MRSFDYDCDSEGVEGLLDTVADLGREPFLDLQAAGECLDDARDFAEAGDGAVGDVGYVSLPDERHDMMFAC